jgi:membrane fusion protein, macrolide-specific efflux system
MIGLFWLKKHPFSGFLILAVAMFVVFFIAKQVRQTHTATFSQPLKRGSMMECVYGVGCVTSDHTFQVKSGIPSKVRTLYVKEGDLVDLGSKLMELEALFTAPFAGVVTSICVSPGEVASPQAPLLNLVDLKNRHVLVTLDQIGALRVQKGQTVNLSFDGLREQTLHGKVTAVYPKDYHFLVRIDVVDLPASILPGMTGDVAIEIVEHANVFLVPVGALDKNQIYIKRNEQKPYPVTIRVGLIDQTMAEVISDELQEGDQLVLQKMASP